MRRSLPGRGHRLRDDGSTGLDARNGPGRSSPDPRASDDRSSATPEGVGAGRRSPQPGRADRCRGCSADPRPLQRNGTTTAWPLSSTRSTGSSAEQRSGLPRRSRSQQRVWKRQPDGGAAGDGTSPRRMIRRRRFSTPGSGMGIADSRATVYGWRGRTVEVARRGDLDDPAEVHHRDPVADVADHGRGRGR